MPAIDFPNSPTLNQLFTSGQTTWIWDGSKWNIYTAGSQGPMGLGTSIIYSQYYV
jgi:hypothetical protein